MEKLSKMVNKFFINSVLAVYFYASKVMVIRIKNFVKYLNLFNKDLTIVSNKFDHFCGKFRLLKKKKNYLFLKKLFIPNKILKSWY